MKNKEQEILNALVADEQVEKIEEVTEIQKPRRRRRLGRFNASQRLSTDYNNCNFRTPFTIRY